MSRLMKLSGEYLFSEGGRLLLAVAVLTIIAVLLIRQESVPDVLWACLGASWGFYFGKFQGTPSGGGS